MFAPKRVISVTVVSIRSVSFTRSSAASRITVSPVAKQAATARMGTSSSMRGIMSPPISTPCRSVEVTRISATGSPPSILSSTSFSPSPAPISSSTSIIPVLLGLRPTPRTRMRAFGWHRPATIQNAAELMSPGTVMSTALSFDEWITRSRPFSSMLPPIAVTIRSVWSRESAGW